jgi:hypothetical protein
MSTSTPAPIPTDRKSLPVKDVAAAGGWKDVTTLIDC